MDSEAKRARAQMRELPLKQRLHNYWYYYKVHFFAAIFAAVLIAITVVECVTEIKYDIKFAMYTVAPYSDEEVSAICQVLKEKCVDINGDNSVNARIVPSIFDITSDKIDEVTLAVSTKLPAELASDVYAALIVDEDYKNHVIKAYGYPKEDVKELTLIPEIKGLLKQDQKLYLLPSFGDKKSDKPTQYDNLELILEYIK